jgi:CheY-like chemotaxis protein
MRSLLVDDQLATVQTLGALLGLEGHSITITSRSSEGIAYAAILKPDVVILDLGMPEIDGFAVARAIRAMELLPRPLLIAFSGYAGSNDVAKGQKAGFDYHFPKTISPEILLKVFKDHAGRVASSELNGNR